MNDPLEIEELRARLAEAEETLRAIRSGEVDALLIGDGSGERVYTLRGADAPYRALVEQMQEGAVTLSDDGDVMYCNRCFSELVDMPLQHIIGMSILQFVEAPDRTAIGTLIAQGRGKLRTRLVNHSESPIDVQVSVGTVIIDDVEHRIMIVTNLRTLAKVQRESQSKDEFLAMLAHELRNPLGAISGAIQVLGLSKLREPRAIHAREVIQRQVLNMAHLVDDLLDVGRVVTGKIVLARQRVDLADTVRSCVAAMTSSQNVERRVEVDADATWVDADPVRLEQIVGNLVGNALKFTPRDRLIRVSVHTDGPDAVLRVADQGCGIPADVLPRIFDLFTQAAVTADRSQGGLGIGLTLVRRLVELHGGTVEAESEGEDRGSTFTVRLRATSPAAARIDARSETKGPSRRVMLVDDHADARAMYSIVLQADGHIVYEAGDGDAALALFRRERPDIAVVDIGMPGMDGYELARRIRSMPEGWRVTLIALTGYGFPEDRERSQAAGFDRHLIKPVAPKDLSQAMEQLVAHSTPARDDAAHARGSHGGRSQG
jgi:signal transduction histidine kinase/CheY-like chemotaxis protein